MKMVLSSDYIALVETYLKQDHVFYMRGGRKARVYYVYRQMFSDVKHSLPLAFQLFHDIAVIDADLSVGHRHPDDVVAYFETMFFMLQTLSNGTWIQREVFGFHDLMWSLCGGRITSLVKKIHRLHWFLNEDLELEYQMCL